MGSLLLIVVLSYLVGSIPASLWLGKALYGKDIRQYGSGNAGATNAFRVFGWKAGVMVTVVDVGKGLLAAGGIASLRIGPLPGIIEGETAIGILAGAAAIVGHIFPIWARFKGGKGMNTSAGVLLALVPITTLIVLGVFFLVLVTSRYVSLASITAAIAFPVTVAIRRYLFEVESLDLSLLVVGSLLAAGVIAAHHSNIRRLLKGTENRVGSFRPAQGMQGRGEI